MKLHELREARARAVTAMRSLADKAETEKRDLNADEEKRFGELKSEIADFDKKIERAQTLADAERSAPGILHNGAGDGTFEERARDFSVVKQFAHRCRGTSAAAALTLDLSTKSVRKSRAEAAVPLKASLCRTRCFTPNDGRFW